MLFLMAALDQTPMRYELGPSVRLAYEAKVTFDGYIPILGGQQGKVEVNMSLSVTGQEPKEGNWVASSKLDTIEILFNGAKLPLTLANVEDFFPKTTCTITPFGRILTSDAPDKKLPVKLPGLDAKRFPDITYLPLEFPEAGAELDKPFQFRKAFGDSPVDYTVTLKKLTDETATFQVEVSQKYSVLEDEASEIVTAEADAIRRVETDVKGGGTIEWDRKLGNLRSMAMDAAAVSKVTDLKTKEQTERNLKTKLEVKRTSPKL